MELAILGASLVSAAVVCAVLTYIEIPFLKRLKAGQNIREEGPKAHLERAGTPTMGGISMLLTFTIFSIALLIFKPYCASTVIPVLLSTLAYAGIGFFDDFLKIKKHQNEGLTSRQKMALQILIGAFFAVYRFMIGNTKVFIPFIKKAVDFGFWIIPFTLFVFIAMTNAVNLTDGLDGLASSVTMNVSLFIAALCMTGLVFTNSNGVTWGYTGNQWSALLSVILSGCCMGFLVFNHHPAKVFMGDTGSLALGACLTGIAMTSSFDFALPIVGLVYVVEALSVIIQVVVFKTQNGRRFFRMAPIHHHFELGGWSEVKVDTVFCIVTVIMGIIALLVF